MHYLIVMLTLMLVIAEAPREPRQATAREGLKPTEKRDERRRVVMPDGRVMDLWYDEKLGRTVAEPR